MCEFECECESESVKVCECVTASEVGQLVSLQLASTRFCNLIYGVGFR